MYIGQFAYWKVGTKLARHTTLAICKVYDLWGVALENFSRYQKRIIARPICCRYWMSRRSQSWSINERHVRETAARCSREVRCSRQVCVIILECACLTNFSDMLIREEHIENPHVVGVPLSDFLENMKDPTKIQAILACGSVGSRYPFLVTWVFFILMFSLFLMFSLSHVDDGYTTLDRTSELLKHVSKSRF